MRTSATIAALFVLLGIARIVSTYHVFSQTADEPAHLAAGLEWLADGTYTYEYQHPPLARIAVALGPWLDGAPSVPAASLWDSGNTALSTRGYWRTLTLARLGTLPFFVLACGVLWLWTRDLYGDAAAVVSVGLFTFLPPVLAHAGLATLDLAAASTTLCAAYCFLRWLFRPSLTIGSILGIAVAAAVLTKFSALLFLPVICGVLILRRATPKARLPFDWKRGVRSGLLALFLCGCCNALIYRGCLAGFWQGIGQVIAHNQAGHDSWLLGEYRSSGWWYFFPVVIGVKTPLAFLALALIGLWRAKLASLCALGVLLVSMPAHINLGVRHILIVYPFLAMMAGAGAKELLAWPRNMRRDPTGRKFAVGLAISGVLGIAVPSFAAHPDYLAYFNELPQHKNYTLAESDLDWGQDLQRLTVKLKNLGVAGECSDPSRPGWRSCYLPEPFYLNYFGFADLSQFDLPPHQPLAAWTPVKGWIAVSVHVLTIENAAMAASYQRLPIPCRPEDCGGADENWAPPGPLDWLKSYQPVAMAGKSILIYYIQ